MDLGKFVVVYVKVVFNLCDLFDLIYFNVFYLY